MIRLCARYVHLSPSIVIEQKHREVDECFAASRWQSGSQKQPLSAVDLRAILNEPYTLRSILRLVVGNAQTACRRNLHVHCISFRRRHASGVAGGRMQLSTACSYSPLRQPPDLKTFAPELMFALRLNCRSASGSAYRQWPHSRAPLIYRSLNWLSNAIDGIGHAILSRVTALLELQRRVRSAVISSQ
jgi:hypothetical protein